MQVKELKSEGLSHELEITIPANDLDKRVEDRLVEYGKGVNIPGFRKGKVPMPVLRQRYGKAMLGEVLEKAVNETSSKVLADKKIKPAMQPKIEVITFDEGKDLVYKMAVESLPEVKIMDLKKIKVERPVAKLPAEKVDETLAEIASNNSTSKKITTKRASKDGDIVMMDFAGRRKRDDFTVEGMSSLGFELTLGSGQFIPGFEEQLVGKKTGEKIEVNVTFPKEYGMPDLAGEEAIFDVTIHELKEAVPCGVDDALAKTVGFDDLPALRKVIEENMTAEYGKMSRLKVKKALLDILDAEHTIELPQGMVDAELASIVSRIEQERAQEHNHAPGEKCDHDHGVADEEKAELKDIAARRVRLGLVLAEIGNANEVVVADQELNQAVIAEAQKYPGQETQVFEYYRSNPQMIETLRAPLFEEKVVDFILEQATVTDKDVTLEALLKEDFDEDAAKKPAAKKTAAKKAPAKKAAAKKADGEAKPAAKKTAAKKPAAKKAAAK
tara:strand:+ start:232320 stop:233816 length:1497 start_codon:yes stop_codon:yes gene_type:complete